MGTYDVNIDNRLTNLENEMLVAESYDSGWQSISVSVFNSVTITHNLNTNLEDLVVEVWGKSQSGDIVARAIPLIYTTSYYGYSVQEIDKNSFYIKTASTGMIILNGTAGTGVLACNEFKVTVTKRKALSFLRSTLGSVGSYVYDTGWVANSDWTDLSATITHNLNTGLSDLIIEFFLSTNGTDAGAYKVGYVNRDIGSGLAMGWAITPISNNSFTLQTGKNGLDVLYSDGSAFPFNSAARYYKVKVYKPDVIDLTLKPTNSIYEINDANNINVAIPSVYDSSIQDEVFIKRVGTGSGVVNISFTSGQDGTSVSTLKGDGGYLHLINNGAKWYIKDYEDFEDISISSTGDSGNLIGRILYHSNGECEFLGKCNPTTNVSAGNAWTGVFDLSSYFDSIREGGNISPDRANGASFARKMYNFGLNLHSNIGNGSIEIGFYTYDSDTYTNSISYYFGVHVIGRWK